MSFNKSLGDGVLRMMKLPVVTIGLYWQHLTDRTDSAKHPLQARIPMILIDDYAPPAFQSGHPPTAQILHIVKSKKLL
ncbi:hypothetical protein RIB2604_02105180 [Aspergillus luchuensis]|uniref:Uncharacterized protein n=1 Tax=Aspergillus kawachii TaxID=1069201 RepID=A0A146FLY0_ASPKA|nr:hypothetical protein RIB2604_02105180 [Aspergillus luchuensis]